MTETVEQIEARVRRELLASGEYIRNPFRAMSAVINQMSRSLRPVVDGAELAGLNERVSVRKYNAAVEKHRQLGLLHVKVEAARVRRELGL